MRTRVSRLFSKVSPWILAIAIALFSALLYLRKTASFRFFDEENNIVAGYLMTQGRALYRDIFMNHNPLPLVISQLLQQAIPSGTHFDLVKLHRVFMVVFALIANGLLLIRFRSKALLFVGAYEYMRFYISGQMFLAEGMMAYMFAYYIFLLIEAYYDKRQAISIRDTLIASFLFAFIVLSREPYVPLVVVLYALVLIRSISSKWAWGCATASFAAVGLFMLQYDLGEFYKQVVLLNGPHSVLESKTQGGLQIYSGIWQILDYIRVGFSFDKPLYLILSPICVLVLLFILHQLQSRRWSHSFFFLLTSILILFLAGIRNFGSGTEWFGMYRSISYIAIITAFASSISSQKTKVALLIVIVFIALLHPRSHFIETRNNASEYYINYSPSYTTGTIIALLCEGQHDCNVFIDGIDVYPYFVSKIKPNYRFAFHYPVNRLFLDYSQVRTESLISEKPIVYYDVSCMISPYKLPDVISQEYMWLNKIDQDGAFHEPSCIAIRKDRAGNVSSSARVEMRKHLYILPDNK